MTVPLPVAKILKRADVVPRRLVPAQRFGNLHAGIEAVILFDLAGSQRSLSRDRTAGLSLVVAPVLLDEAGIVVLG